MYLQGALQCLHVWSVVPLLPLLSCSALAVGCSLVALLVLLLPHPACWAHFAVGLSGCVGNLLFAAFLAAAAFPQLGKYKVPYIQQQCISKRYYYWPNNCWPTSIPTPSQLSLLPMIVPPTPLVTTKAGFKKRWPFSATDITIILNVDPCRVMNFYDLHLTLPTACPTASPIFSCQRIVREFDFCTC